MYLLNECYGFFFFIVSYNDYSPKDHRPAGQNCQTTLPTNFVWFEFLPMEKKELKNRHDDLMNAHELEQKKAKLAWDGLFYYPLYFFLSLSIHFDFQFVAPFFLNDFITYHITMIIIIDVFLSFSFSFFFSNNIFVFFFLIGLWWSSCFVCVSCVCRGII